MRGGRFNWAAALGLAAFGMLATARAGADTPAGGSSGRDMFQRMDTNGDGKVSADEHAAGARRMFETMDANHDGRVTAREMDAAHEQVTGQKAKRTDLSAADKIKAIDTDGDGAVSAEEHEAGSKIMFEKMDSDGDGSLTRSEMDAGHARLLHKSPKK